MQYLERYEGDAVNPNWEEFDREWKHVHDWRTYVPRDLRADWGMLPLIARCAVIHCCQEAAGREEWD